MAVESLYWIHAHFQILTGKKNAKINLSLVSKVKSRGLEAWHGSVLTQPRILTCKRTTDRTLFSGKCVYFSGIGN